MTNNLVMKIIDRILKFSSQDIYFSSFHRPTAIKLLLTCEYEIYLISDQVAVDGTQCSSRTQKEHFYIGISIEVHT